MRCLFCMQEMPDGSKKCPHCSYRGDAVVDANCLPPGTILAGRYQIGLNHSTDFTFGIDYAAWDGSARRRVMIKEFFPNDYAVRQTGSGFVVPRAPGYQDRLFIGRTSFIGEARKLMKFSALPGIVTIYDCFEENGTAYLVMEYMEGETLEQRLEREKKMKYSDLQPMFLSLMESLEKVHAFGILHKDIAPPNIFIRSDGSAVLTNFGAFRYAIKEHSHSLTSMLMVGYAPIEQYSSMAAQGTWSDVYALAATMYKALSGITPQPAADRAAKDGLRPIHRVARGIPVNAATAIMNALNLMAANRTQTVAALREELDGIVKVHRKKERIKREKLNVPKAAVAAIIIFGVIAAGLVIAIGRGKDPDPNLIPEGMVQIPAVNTLQLAEAERLLADCDLKIRVSGRVYDDYFEENLVLSQNPHSGTIAYAGSVVDVTVSSPEIRKLVPNVNGMKLSDAMTILDVLGFAVETVEVMDDSVAPNLVVSQSVEPDTEAAQDTVIVLQYNVSAMHASMDPSVPTVVPPVTGLALSKAKDEALASGLYVVVEEYVYDSTVPAGCIISQSPESGSGLMEGGEILLRVSSSQAELRVPDLLYFTASQASDTLYQYGLYGAIEYEESNTVAAGLVIRHEPDFNTVVRTGDTVTVYVSTGYRAQVPQVAGMELSQAVSAITAAGLASSTVMSPSDTVPAGYVIDQSIASGEMVEQGTIVTLTVSSGVRNVPVTGISVSRSSVNMSSGSTMTLYATLKPGDATNTAVTWSSTDQSVATVSPTGTVTAIRSGRATIIATSVDGQYSANCIVNVDKVLTSIDITSTPNKYQYRQGEALSTAGLEVTAGFSDGSTQIVTDSCSTSGFDPYQSGLQYVYVHYTYGEETRSARFTVNVTRIQPASISITSTPRTSFVTGEAFSSAGLGVTAYYSDGSSRDVTGSCLINSSEYRETPGVYSIEVKYSEGDTSLYSSYMVTVSGSISLDYIGGVPLDHGASGTVSIRADSGVSLSGNAVWSSSNPSAVEVYGSGSTATVTGVGAGTSTITVTVDGLTSSVSVSSCGPWSGWSESMPSDPNVGTKKMQQYRSRQKVSLATPPASAPADYTYITSHSSYSGWSSWQVSFDYVAPSDTCEVDSYLGYNYYHFQCPCGAYLPYYST